jgi:hypothetical protein
VNERSTPQPSGAVANPAVVNVTPLSSGAYAVVELVIPIDDTTFIVLPAAAAVSVLNRPSPTNTEVVNVAFDNDDDDDDDDDEDSDERDVRVCIPSVVSFHASSPKWEPKSIFPSGLGLPSARATAQ